MEYYAGIDVSLELWSVCVVDGRGKIVKEAKVASEPEALVYFFKELGFPVNRIGFEAGPLSQWLHEMNPAGKVRCNIANHKYGWLTTIELLPAQSPRFATLRLRS